MPEDTATPELFETALAELQQVVERLEAGDLSLEETLQLFERGITLRDRCQKELSRAETRVEILTRRDEKLIPEPFEPEEN